MPKSIIGRIRFILNPLDYLYLYVGDWAFCKWNYDREIKKFGYTTDSIVDIRNDCFANCFIDIWRDSGRLNTVESPEKALVMFWWNRKYLKSADLRFYGKAI